MDIYPFRVAVKSDARPHHIQTGFAMLMKAHGSCQAELICAAHKVYLLLCWD